MIRFIVSILCLVGVCSQAAAADEPFPKRPVMLVVATPPGSTPDIGARAVAQAMSQTLNQPVIVENRPGANGLIAVKEVVRSADDGYTILVAAASTMAINPHIYVNQSAGLLKDLTAVGKIFAVDFCLVVRSDSGIDSLRMLVSRAKVKPGALVAANGGAGSASQLAVEVLKQQAGIDIYQVPFNGSPSAALAVASGTADLLIETFAVTQSLVSGGRIKRLAVTGQRRSPAYPDVPTMAEAGVPGMELSSWTGMFARTTVPAQRIAILNAALSQALAKPEIQKLLRTAELTPGGNSSSDFQREWLAQSARWAEVVGRTPGLKIN